MSHMVLQDLEIKDLECFAQACEDCGLEFRPNQKTHKWYGRWVRDYNNQDAAYKQGVNAADYGKCIHAAAVKGNSRAYEIGLVANPHGEGFVPVYDFYAGGHGLMHCIGGPPTEKQASEQFGANKNCNRLMMAYAQRVGEKIARVQGLSFEVTTLPDGRRVMVCDEPVQRSATVGGGRRVK